MYSPPVNMLGCTVIMNEDPNITLVRSFFTTFGEGRPSDVRSALETFLSEHCCYGERFKSRGAVLRWLLGDQYDEHDAAELRCFWPEESKDRERIVRIVPEVKRAAVNGNVVFVERVDHLYDTKSQEAFSSRRTSVMEIQDGKIASWQDYSAYDGELARTVESVSTMPDDFLSYINRNIALLRGQYPRECPICGYSGFFRAHGFPPRLDAQCSNCGSLERHRLFFLHCIRNGSLDGCDTLLHFAPEPILKDILRDRVKNYVTADIKMNDVDRKLDIENIDIASGQIDAVVCIHVLEHVDDVKALNELFRILKPGGRLYCMVPIVEGWTKTYENSSVTDDDQRTLHFGQHDHLRFYGKDFRERIAEAGFFLDEFTAFGEAAVKYRLLRGDKVFVCRKPATFSEQASNRLSAVVRREIKTH